MYFDHYIGEWEKDLTDLDTLDVFGLAYDITSYDSSLIYA